MSEGEERHPEVSVETPKSRDERGEGGEVFDIARSGRCADLP